MKKKVLIVFTGALELGGIETSLLGMLDSFDYDKYEVDLFLYGHHGNLFHLINKNVNILPEVKELAFLRESLMMKVKNKCFYSALLRIRDSIKSKFVAVDQDRTWADIMRRCAPAVDKNYDIAISFFLPFDYIKEKVKARIRIGWIHTDYNGDKSNREALYKEYRDMDYIAAVSDDCAESFKKIFPKLSNKVLTVENILSEEYIINRSESADVEDEMKIDGTVKLLSIGRFSEAKNFDNVPEICKLIREFGLNIKWYLIGFGGDEDIIRQKIQEHGMQDYVIILGKKVNPYPYINACDLYVQPSRYEGKCVAVREAQILHKPVVITKYATSGSQLKDGYDGIIVPMDNVGCAKGIADLIRNDELRNCLIENTKHSDYTNSGEIQKIYNLIDD